MNWLSLAFGVLQIGLELAARNHPQVKTAMLTYLPVAKAVVEGLAPAAAEAEKAGVRYASQTHDIAAQLVRTVSNVAEAPDVQAIQNAQRERVDNG